MKIAKYGTVVIGEGSIKIEDWLITPELTDPPEATPEQMLLEVAIPWAQKKLNAAILSELQRVSKSRKASAALTKNPTQVD